MDKPNFLSIVFFYTNIALQHLGVVRNPLTDKVEKNLDLAKYIIDTMDLIKEKTRGNLTEKEENILAATLSDLKLSYIRMKEIEEKEAEEEIKKKGEEKAEGEEQKEKREESKKGVKGKKKKEGKKEPKKTRRKIG